jgi:uncharacterized membrane protein
VASLLAAALLWLGVHLGIAGTTVRAGLAARLGETGFRIAFSLASLVSISLLVIAWRAAPTVPLWSPPAWLLWVLAAVMLAAAILFVGSVTVANPTAAGSEAAIAAEPRGMIRLTRHPMLWAFALWAGVHVAGNGDLASLVFFGAFLVTALAGMPSLDAKLSARAPGPWAMLAARTSILPGAAIAAGRNRLVWRELLLPVGAGLVLWLVLLLAHPYVIGVSPLPA